MAERQETSVMASIQDILRDAKLREEQEKVEEDRKLQAAEQERVALLRRQQEAEEARIRADEEERQRKAFEEQRRAAEIAALQEAAVQKAKSEAEAQARMAEMAARQEHERQLHAMKHDKSKKVLRFSVIGIAAVLLIGGGFAIKQIKDSNDRQAVIAAQLAQLQDQIAAAKQKEVELQNQLAAAASPEEKAALQAQLEQARNNVKNLSEQAAAAPHEGAKSPVAHAAGGGGNGGGAPAARPSKPAKTEAPKPCDCKPGDPLCSCL